MNRISDIELKPSNRKPKNIIAGAVDIAIEKAERYGTPLVIKTNGKIREVSPAQMKRIVKSSSR